MAAGKRLADALSKSRDVAQGASNAAASAVSFPVDALAWLLRKGGVDVGEPVGGSDWMARQGLTAKPQNVLAGIIGESLGGVAPMVAAAKAPQVANALLKMGDNMAAPRMLDPQTGAIVWHGSPHKFDRFDASKIGTGEGAQAYGHGLYLAEAPEVAKTYKDLDPVALSAPVRMFKGVELNAGTPEYHAATLLDNMGLQQARKAVAQWISQADPRMAREAEGWKRTLETLNAATSKADFKRAKNTGNLYKVDLHDNAIARMLDWDKPLSQQAPGVQNTMARVFGDDIADDGTDKLHRLFGVWDAKDLSGERLYMEMNRRAAGRAAANLPDAAKRLSKAGIPGIRYLDGGSRGAGTGTSNFVVFPGEENILRILERNGQPLGR